MAMAEGSNSPAEGYLDWAQEELGVVVHHPLRVSSTPGKEERGVFCEENIPAETIVVSVPWEVGDYMSHSNFQTQDTSAGARVCQRLASIGGSREGINTPALILFFPCYFVYRWRLGVRCHWQFANT